MKQGEEKFHKVNLSTPRPKGRGLLEVHPEPRLSTPPSKAGLRAAERVNPGTYVLVWIGLFILTGITVSLGGMNLKGLSILVPLLVAATKSGLVLSYFMHLKYETGLLFKLMIPIVLATLTIFIGLTFSDVAFR
jgi:cytochrome c oxidase subunit 4